METVFITIHDLSLDARIKYCSDSIEDILGYIPREVTGRSCWEYFHPDEVPFAREIHGRGVNLDKAAVMNYCRIKHKDGSWIGCECVFTVVHDVLVASTAIYRRGPKARQRALDGAGIRRIFSSSPRDPRYHMLSYLSNKFYREPSTLSPEPRAALFLNRFTRTSTIMYATNGVSSILGLQPGEIIGKSFYYCIQQSCLPDAVKCLESAKANDSIAYLRFWYRNPLQEDNRAYAESLADGDESDEDEDGGVPLRGTGTRSGSSVSMVDGSTPRPIEEAAAAFNGESSTSEHHESATRPNGIEPGPSQLPTAQQTAQSEDPLAPPTEFGVANQRSASDNSTDLEANAREAIFDPPASQTSESVRPPEELSEQAIEIEAVVSCSSDGLVVILRRAQPLVPHTLGATESPYYANGLFASPWAPEPFLPPASEQAAVGSSASLPSTDDTESGFMAAIRDVAVFAWSLTGINGSLAEYARGQASGEALPPGGFPVWDPDAKPDPVRDDLFNGFMGSAHRPFEGMNEPLSTKKDDELVSSEDEVVWKRVPQIPAWRRPKRRGHGDAFGADGSDTGDGENKDGGRKRVTKSNSASGTATGSGSGSGSEPGSTAGST